MIALIWPDGHVDRAETYRALERAIRTESWLRSYGRRGYRREMARRAVVFSGATVPTRGSARAFLRSLEAAGLFRLEEDDR